MIDIRKCKHHGVCTNCFKQQDSENTIYELRASTTGQGSTNLEIESPSMRKRAFGAVDLCKEVQCG